MSITLYGKSDFVKDFGRDILSKIILVGPKCNRKMPHKREAEGDLTAKEKLGDVIMKVSYWRKKP